MRKLICVLLAAVLILGSVPAWAAENRVKLTGEWIYIDENTESTVWVDQKGGTLVWDKDANTLTFNSFNYDCIKVLLPFHCGFDNFIKTEFPFSFL